MLNFPLPMADFFFRLPIAASDLDLPEALDVAETAAGEVLVADVGVQLWRGQIDIELATHDEAAAIRPLLNVLRRAGTSFLVSDCTRPWPRLDPEGALLAGSAPAILALGSSPRELSLTGLPPFYPLAQGDLLSFSYGSGRHALHELVGSVSANAAGQTALVEVSPPIRPGAVPGASVRLLWPCCKAVIVPGTISLGRTSHTVTSGISFRWSQTLR